MNSKTTLTKRKNVLAAMVGLFAAAGGASSAMAQGDEAATAQGRIDEIIVTANKREQSLQDTAMSISALSGDTIDKRGLVGMDDYLRTIPGVSFQDRGAGQNSIVMRGISANPQTDNEAVGVYFNETPISGLSNAGNGGGAGNLDIKMVDIERVEVLRGPQGTLYGSGSMGGTVRMIPEKPNLDNLEGSITARFSNTGEKGGDNTMIQGVINIPVVEDRLAVRGVAYRFDNSGYIDNIAASDDPAVDALLGSARSFGGTGLDRNDIGSDEYTGFRLAALWNPTDVVDLSLSYINQEIEQFGWPEVNLDLGEFQQARLPVRDGRSEGLSNEVEIVNLLLNLTTSWGKFTSASSWIDYDQLSRFDLGLFGVPADAEGKKKVDNFVQELRFSSSFDGPFQVLGGIYYENRESSRDFTNLFTGDPSFEDAVIALFASPPLPDTFFAHQVFVEDVEQKALFGELSYQVTDRFEVTFGGRYFDYTQHAPVTSTGIFGEESSSQTNEDTGSTYKINLSYSYDDDILFYGQWAEGFRLGAPQTPLPSFCDSDANGLIELPDGSEIAISDNVAPDELENYELGVKTSLANNRVIFNASIYRINWNAIPVQTTLACGFAAIINAGESKSEGLELESQLLLTNSMRLNLGASFNEATLTEDAPGLGAGAIDGADLPGSADFNFFAGLEYEFTISNNKAFARIDYSYVGEYFSNFSEMGQNAGNYSMVNVKTGASFDNLNVDLFINNLTNTNKYTWTENFFSQFGFSRAYQLRPRTIGLNLRYRF